MTQSFVGFADSDKFLAALDPSRPVNLNINRQHGKADKRYGLAVDSTVLIMSQVRGCEVLYFEHVVHRYQVMNGQYFVEAEKEEAMRLADQVRKATEEYLSRHNITWRDALLSMPMNYTKLDGEPTFLKWDKETEAYSYQETAEEHT